MSDWTTFDKRRKRHRWAKGSECQECGLPYPPRYPISPCAGMRPVSLAIAREHGAECPCWDCRAVARKRRRHPWHPVGPTVIRCDRCGLSLSTPLRSPVPPCPGRLDHDAARGEAGKERKEE